MPLVGDVGANTKKQTRFYICRERLPGFVRADKAGLHLWAHKRNLKNQADPKQVVTTKGTRTDTLTVGHGCGGIIQEWRSEDTSAGYDIQWLSKAGLNRGIGAQIEYVDAAGNQYHPTQAGSLYDTGPDIGTYTDGYASTDVVQGSLLVGFRFKAIAGSWFRYRVVSVPLEWDPRGTIYGTDHHGDFLNAIVYPDIRITTEADINFLDVAGLHSIATSITVPEFGDLGDVSTHITHDIALRFGFDQVIAYDGGYTDMVATELVPAISDTVASYTDQGGDVLTVTLSSAHSRPAGTIHRVTFAGMSGSPDINGDWTATFTTSTAFTIVFPGHALNYTGGTVSAPARSFADTGDNSQIREALNDQLVISGTDGQGGADLSGTYPDKSEFVSTNAFHGVIYRALAAGGAAWSLDTDFAVGLLAQKIDSRTTPGGQRGFRFSSRRGVAAPPGGDTDPEWMQLAFQRKWPSDRIAPRGQSSSVVTLLTGTYAEVQALIAAIDP